ncbi:hypothetical protein BKA70DRAFT_1251858, partial [Coprinopsis sp. MPI-PUGE-AT-0042]
MYTNYNYQQSYPVQYYQQDFVYAHSDAYTPDAECYPQHQGYYYEPALAQDNYEQSFPAEAEHQRTGLVVHAPMPVLGQSSMLASNLEEYSNHLDRYHPPMDMNRHYYCDEGSQYSRGYESQLSNQNSQSLPPATFPTPSELLVELSYRSDGIAPSSVPCTTSARDASPTGVARGSEKAPTPTVSSPATSTTNESLPGRDKARKPRRRGQIPSVNTGFMKTDPDSISSHEKKRRYLECLENYVTYLEAQLRLIGVAPVRMRREETYRGLGSRSIRTLLVHMENENHKMNLRTNAQEQKV